MSAFCFALSQTLCRGQAKLWDDDEQGDSTATTEEGSSFLHFLVRSFFSLDIPGVLLAIAGFSLLLLAPTHFPGTQEGWSAVVFSGALVFGFMSMAYLFIWECHLGLDTCFPVSLMKNRPLVWGCGAVIFMATSTACWSTHLSSYLQVVENQTAFAAGRVAATRTIAFACSAPLIGL